MRSKYDFENLKGITLIALVITVVVLLILAGVTIATLTGDNGLLINAKTAVNKYSEEEIKENISLSYINWKMDNYLSDSTNLSEYIKLRLEEAYPNALISCIGNGLIEISIEINSQKYKYVFNISNGSILNPQGIEYTDFTISADNYQMVGITREGDVVIPSIFYYNGTYYKVTGIGKDAFKNCISLTGISLPDTITTIGDDAFRYCNNLKSIYWTHNITNLRGQIFCRCTNLESITMPKQTEIHANMFLESGKVDTLDFPCVTSIGAGAFQRYPLKVLILRANTVCSIATNSFNFGPFRNGTGGTVYVPEDLIDDYEDDENWSQLESVTFLPIEGSEYE